MPRAPSENTTASTEDRFQILAKKEIRHALYLSHNMTKKKSRKIFEDLVSPTK
ncbi:hypothetical protein HanXRQr2_Chr11g0472911 [Helianthus annuus]|uniref:Uncharacterized protein n=1 Tax=Helianthus annuus TaxID=4232 RepID=A0A9K3MZ47_HELAN|nr:hypothetical protein HanXRQr2_Chr11g0472911 [Helianthus annuus]KAJ0873756.1 hypothetical protein HanPSC8_Chr11g0456081 [Helianthus annuus]